MDISTDYLPHAIFAPGDREGRPLPRVFIAPQRYIQGPGVLTGIGRYLSVMQPKRVALLMSERGLRHEGVRLVEGLRSADIESVEFIFGGECSSEQIASQVDAMALAGVDCVIAAGGGKCVDTGKAVAHRLNLRLS